MLEGLFSWLRSKPEDDRAERDYRAMLCEREMERNRFCWFCMQRNIDLNEKGGPNDV